MSRKMNAYRSQLVLSLEQPTPRPTVAECSKELLNALADLLLEALRAGTNDKSEPLTKQGGDHEQ